MAERIRGTAAEGAPSTCPDCGEALPLQVCRSAAGYYIGTMCRCGPYSRESEYFCTRGQAERALRRGAFGR